MARGARDAPIRARVDASGSWSAAGLIPGRYQLSVSGLGNGMITRSAMFNGLDILDESLEVDGERSIDGVRIQVTTHAFPTHTNGAICD
jgi:hypothetical protein